jgi:DNA-binding NarL/FixJ family response regulator
MIVESQPITRAALSATFSAEGINVVANIAESQRALQVACILDPDLILYSLNTPNFDEMLRIMILRRELPHTRILVLVTGEFTGQESTARDYGAHQVLSKSTHRNELLDTVRALTH